MCNRRDERQEEFLRIDRWLQEFHQRAPILFNMMACGIALMIFGIMAMIVEMVGR
jgi:hypothetical protein